jgi:HAD superfamily hydrolase (TIGR01509 family)
MTGAIFDLDGTLLDSMAIWDNFGADYLKSKKIVSPDDLYQTLKPMSLLQAVDYFKESFQLNDTAEEMIQQFSDIIGVKYKQEVTLKPHVAEFLEVLKNRNVRMCVATATDRKQAEETLKNLGVAHYFSFILTCTEVGSGKDHPEIFEQALKRLGTDKKETVVFEDALHAIMTAKEAGFRVIGIHDFSAEEDAERIKKVADSYIHSFAECEVSEL